MDIKLGVQKTNVNKFILFCDSVTNTPEQNKTKGFIESKSRMIIEMWNKLDANHDSILLEVTDDEKARSVYFSKMEFEKAFQYYDAVMLHLQTALEQFNKPVIPNVPPIQLPSNLTLNATGDKSKLKLKPVDIPTFSGDYKKWISFRKVFDSMVHNDKKIDKLDKMHYLKSSVSGEAERIISQFDITPEAYDEAYKVITERFHNEVILVDTHIMSILSQPNLTSESGTDIKELMDVTTENLRALKFLNIDTTTWDPILLLLLVQKLDRFTRRLWEQTLKPKVRPTMKEFLEFLETRFYALGCQQNFSFSIGTIEKPQSKYRNFKKAFGSEHTFNDGQVFPPRVHQNFHNTSQSKQKQCPFGCGEIHNATDCERFRKSKLEMRMELVNGSKLCKNCLKSHFGKCSLKPGCQKCGKYHHTLIHPVTDQLTNQGNSANNTANAKPQQSNQANGSSLSLKNHHIHTQQGENHKPSNNNHEGSECIAWDEPVLLATAIVLIRSERDNSFYPFRALLDQASEASYVTENVLQFLGLKRKSVVAATSGLGGVKTGNIKYVVDFELGSKRNPAFSMKVQAPVAQKISNLLPSSCLDKIDWDHIKDLQLADPDFRTPGKIDLLLGAPVYGYLLLPGLRKVSPTIPVAQNTEFGWILSGGTRTPKHNLVTFHLKIELEDQLRKFFEQEEVSKERILTQEEVACEDFFKETVQRDHEGRYIVALPFKKDPNLLGSSKGQAFSRLIKLESRLEANKDLKEEYTQILNEYETLNHTSVIGQLDKSKEASSYYLPHHAVFKPESTTTKTRIVFDASAKTTNGLSLNDSLMTGPTLQQDLMSILLRWRMHRIVFTADIAKMYRQVLVRKQDRKFQRFLFRDDISKAIMEYEHNMVTFGVTSATFLAVAALQDLAESERENYPEAAEIILKDFYMDDGMSGADTVQQAVKLCKDLKEVLAKAKFPLRKFISNSAELLESLPESDRELKLPLEINIDNNIKTLGIRYDPATDSFQFKVNLDQTTESPTKRSLLSETAKLFDPLGWLAPVVIRAKIMFQDLWQAGLEWNQKLPKDIADKWLEFRNELHQLEKIKVDRWLRFGSEIVIFEIHGFCDASVKAYAAVIYTRVVNQDGSIHIKMLTSKTRVAPIKPVTLPRLE